MNGMDALLTAGAGLVAGAVNAVAGGGTLIAFPALLAAGLPAVTANITSSTGLVTGYAGGALGYRRELSGQLPRLRALAPAAVLGGIVGAVILLVTPKNSFKAAVPFLVLIACLLLASQSKLSGVVARRRAAKAATPTAAEVHAASAAPAATPTAAPAAVPAAAPAAAAPLDGGPPGTVAVAAPGTVPVVATAQAAASTQVAVRPVTWPTRIGVFVAGAYGSYFGAGLGVLLLAVMGILLVDDLQRTNALKTLLSFIVNAVGVIVFLASAQVAWAYAGVLVVTSAVGGVLGARVARNLPPVWLRRGVITLGLAVAVVLFVRDFT
ncbi:sulfite exporter TauE/SafE family protein [Frankia sp. AgB1.9]|uniref:sulfite exporter TauE/SafE family protein n=1 Tax=unclassified Frankia TaxID=2632575 RepID=UPI0019318894|nr:MULTISPECIES: sulfite exporter TauE/SafE family protein [unclassified Frankia]MBL7494307.1 sulfite exporter TauE/SafE family protein [Frankia sp. AgW1.1]MBL7548207.1 sulfite exporter TauE/SafE family protein [Frankia sp. AgB1.9]